MDRRTFLALSASLLSGCQQNQSEQPTEAPLPDRVELEWVADGDWNPTDMAFLPDRDLRYILTHSGEVLLHDADGLRDESLIDLTDQVVTEWEMGMLGIELHPEFADNGRLFLRYSAEPRAGTPEDYSHTFVLSEYQVSDDGTRVDSESERTVVEIPEPQKFHNAGDILFGPEGHLYLPTGDGGNEGDTGPGHADDWYAANEGGNGQDTSENLLGGILRIDVDAEPSEHHRTDGDAPDAPDGDHGYAIPEDNPLVNEEGHRDEYYAWGMRNPWRLSFDDERLFAIDVGQDRWEEVNLVEKGGNYGWNVKEGTHCFDTENMEEHLDECPDETPEDVRGGEPLIDPIIEYPNEEPTDGTVNGDSIIGGHHYRGTDIPGLEGRFVFGDINPAGRLFVGTPSTDEESTEMWETDVLNFTDETADYVGLIHSLARDPEGELYILAREGIYRVTSVD